MYIVQVLRKNTPACEQAPEILSHNSSSVYLTIGEHIIGLYSDAWIHLYYYCYHSWMFEHILRLSN